MVVFQINRCNPLCNGVSERTLLLIFTLVHRIIKSKVNENRLQESFFFYRIFNHYFIFADYEIILLIFLKIISNTLIYCIKNQ